MEKKLTLTEALCGFNFVVPHMDNRALHIKSAPGKVTKHEHLQVSRACFYYIICGRAMRSLQSGTCAVRWQFHGSMCM
jgi:hypothetical protein